MLMGEGGARSGLETSQGGRGEHGAGFVISPRGSPQGANQGKAWETGTPQGSTSRLNIDEQGVRVSKKRYPEQVKIYMAQAAPKQLPGWILHHMTNCK